MVMPLTMVGCAVLDAVFGTTPGTPHSDGSTSPIAIGGSWLNTIIPGAAALAGAARWAYVEYKHNQLVKVGKKDDDNDGIDDATQGTKVKKKVVE